MRGDALALQEDLDGARRQPYFDFAAGEAVGNAVEVSLHLDVVIDADPPCMLTAKQRRRHGNADDSRGAGIFDPKRAGQN